MDAGTFEMSWLRPMPQRYSCPPTALVRKLENAAFPAICAEKTKKQRKVSSRT